MTNALQAADALANKGGSERGPALKALLEAISVGEDLNARNDQGMRAIDVLVRGEDGDEAAAAIEAMAEQGFGESMLLAPNPSEMPPLVAACYQGNALMVEMFLSYGFPADARCNAPTKRLLNGTAFHAVVLGFREVCKDDFAQTMKLLLTYCPEGINLADRLRQRPVDYAAKAAAQTGDRTLSDAIVSYGVSMSNGTGMDANAILKELAKKPKPEELKAVMTRGLTNGVLRQVDSDAEAGELISRTLRP